MHMLESCSHTMKCIPVVHEVAAGIAAEYFNELHDGQEAFAMVTAGPGLTNIVTAMGGAYLESRELLVIGGQVKVPICARARLRQRGIQEINGVAIARPMTETAILMEQVVDRATFAERIRSRSAWAQGAGLRRTPLDVQGAQVDGRRWRQRWPRGRALRGGERGGGRAIVEKLRRAQAAGDSAGRGVDRERPMG